MEQNKLLALELTKSLINNPNVVPVCGREHIEYVFGTTRYSFSELVAQFLEGIDDVNKW